MALDKFLIQPDENGYSITPGDEVVQVELDGGFSRTRRDVANASEAASVQWTFDLGRNLYFWKFYREKTRNGSLPFLLDLVHEDEGLVEREVKFRKGSVALASSRGLQRVVTAQLEIKPLAEDSEFANAVIALFEETSYDNFLQELEDFVNITMPNSL